MSILLLDIGNTRLKWTLAADQAQLPLAQAIPHFGQPATALAQLAAQPAIAGDPASIQRIWVAHVMGAAHEAGIGAAIQQHFPGVTVLFARSAATFHGWRSVYQVPERLGVDRYLAMIGCWQKTTAAFCIASAGTALTFDAVDGRGQHLGGVIAPGLAAMTDATLGRTRFAAQAIPPTYDNTLGQDTESAVREGSLHAAAGLLDRLGQRQTGRRYLCGGDASTLAPWLAQDWQVAPDAVLQGLAVLAQQTPSA